MVPPIETAPSKTGRRGSFLIALILVLFFASEGTSALPGLDSIILQAAKAYRLSPALIKAIIDVESSFNPDAKSPAGAVGLMQLMPRTAEAYGASIRENPADSVFAGTRYLRYLVNRYGGRVNLALAAYNAGETKVDKYNDVPPIKETKEYVKKVLERYNILKKEHYFK